MALSLQSANLVRQKVKLYQNFTAAEFGALKAFFLYWSTNKRNADLQYIPFSNITSADPGICQATGYSPIGGVTSTVHVFYVKNDGTGDGTDSFVSLHNNTTNTNVDLAYVTGMISDDNESFLYINPKGLAFGTDLTISAATTNGGQTESAAANAGNGFVIVSA